MRRRVTLRAIVALVLAGVVAVFAATAAGSGSSAGGPFVVVASGLDNPRGIALGPHGKIYVAEAGRGGRECVETENEEGELVTLCLGRTGAVTLIRGDDQRRIGPRLPSIAEEDGSFATGVHDVSLAGGKRVFAVLGDGLTDTETFGRNVRRLGTLLRLHGDDAEIVANLAAFEAAKNPDGGDVNPNAYGVLALPRKHQVVADAGGNALLSVKRREISTVAVFPPQLVDAPPLPGFPPQIPAESVPTAVARGPDGAYYVGEFTGFPFPVDKARVWRVVPGEEPEVFATGFTNIIDLAFGRHGSLYLLEFAKAGLLSGDPTGALTRIAPDGSRTEIASAGLVLPGGVAVRRNGTIYVTNYSVFAGRGEVVRIRR